jgi:hypothetical protein
MVAHHRCRIVHQTRNLGLVLAVADDFGKKFNIVAPASLDELFLD